MSTELHLPALRCVMGAWTYYTTSMQLREVAERIVYAKDLVPSKALRDLLQRNLKGKRTEEISNYLIQESEHFFGALIVAVHKGQPNWLSMDVKPSDVFDLTELGSLTSKRLQETVGFLKLNGDEELWALDGQHRLSGIKLALSQEPGLGNEEITIIFVGHEESAKGLERTRRLFTTLNRNAKPISTGERIALDEDDACAILTRRLVESHKLLSGDSVAATEKGQLTVANKVEFTVISMIYSVNTLLLNNRVVLGQKWNKKKLLDGRRPTEPQLAALLSATKEFWDGLVTHVPEVASYVKSKSVNRAVKYRNEDGGHLLFRPVGLDVFAKAFNKLRDQGTSVADCFKKLMAVKAFQLSNPIWSGVLWNSVNKSVIAKSANRILAADFLLYFAGVPTDVNELRARYRKIVEDADKELPTLE